MKKLTLILSLLFLTIACSETELQTSKATVPGFSANDDLDAEVSNFDPSDLPDDYTIDDDNNIIDPNGNVLDAEQINDLIIANSINSQDPGDINSNSSTTDQDPGDINSNSSTTGQDPGDINTNSSTTGQDPEVDATEPAVNEPDPLVMTVGGAELESCTTAKSEIILSQTGQDQDFFIFSKTFNTENNLNNIVNYWDEIQLAGDGRKDSANSTKYDAYVAIIGANSTLQYVSPRTPFIGDDSYLNWRKDGKFVTRAGHVYGTHSVTNDGTGVRQLTFPLTLQIKVPKYEYNDYYGRVWLKRECHAVD